MGQFGFRFVASEPADAGADDQFWRDVEVADRLGSRLAASFFLRELCRTRALEDVGSISNDDDVAFVRSREDALLRQIEARGYDVNGSAAERLSRAG